MPPSNLDSAETAFMQRFPELGYALLQLLILVSFSQTEEPFCRQQGDQETPQLYKDGDINLGGIFYFHSSWKNEQYSYKQKPLALQCIR